MKIIVSKKVETITETIEVVEGIYYFREDIGTFYKVDFEEPDKDGFLIYDVIKIDNYSDMKQIKTYGDGGDKLPNHINNLFIKNTGKITKELFESQLDIIINKFRKKE